MRGSRNLTGRSPLAPLGEPDTHSALKGAVPETGIPFQLPNMRSLRTGLLFRRERDCQKGLCPFLTKGLQSAARTSCPLTADKTHTCSLSCIFCQVHAPTENDQNPFAACGRQTLRGFFDRLSHASDRCHWRENPPDERYCVLIRAQIPTDFRTKHGRKSFRCPIQRGISTALRPLFVTERNRRSRLLARSSLRTGLE